MHHILTLGPSQDYELLDSGDQLKLERFGSYVLGRPETQAICKATNLGDGEGDV